MGWGVGAGYDGGSVGGSEARLGAGGGGAYADVFAPEPIAGGEYGAVCAIELCFECFVLSFAFCRLSICPSTVVPLNAKSSSGIPTNFTTPRTGVTPSASAMKA